MTVALALVAALAILALAAIALRSQLAPGPSLRGRTVTINMTGADSIAYRGVLVAEHADRMTLAEVIGVHVSGDKQIPGLLHVPREQISTIQEIPPGA